MFRHACKLGLEGIVSKCLGSPYRSGRTRWIKSKNPKHPAVKREAEEEWGKEIMAMNGKNRTIAGTCQRL